MSERFSEETRQLVAAMTGLLPANIKKKGDDELLQPEDLARLETKYSALGIKDLSNEYVLWKARWRRLGAASELFTITGTGDRQNNAHEFHIYSVQ